jgi:hypothetical protein
MSNTDVVKDSETASRHGPVARDGPAERVRTRAGRMTGISLNCRADPREGSDEIVPPRRIIQ